MKNKLKFLNKESFLLSIQELVKKVKEIWEFWDYNIKETDNLIYKTLRIDKKFMKINKNNKNKWPSV